MNTVSHFEPRSASTPKRASIASTAFQLCSTPKSSQIRYSLAKCAPRPVDASTPQSKKSRKSLAPDLHNLLYPSGLGQQSSFKIWVL